MEKPLLSIGIIFKNEIRCLERCLKSFQSLRNQLPCELILADTGSDDGSREIAGKYADILFDFPWIDDFSAARNAVMDRASGKWYLSVDADEWLDEDISQLVDFLRDGSRKELIYGITIRNYVSPTDTDAYSDFFGVRILRMSTGLRYVGTIHERWENPEGSGLSVYPLDKTVLHHDGYVMLNDGSEAGQEKLQRNRRLLEREMEADPDNLLLLTQYIESWGKNYKEQVSSVRRGVELVRAKQENWELRGANLLRYAVHAAHKQDLPELKEWIALAEEMFPDSIYTRLEVQFDASEHAWCDMDCPELIARGRKYIKGAQDYRAGRFDVNEALQSPLASWRFHHETTLRICVARAYVYEHQPKEALEILQILDYDTMDGDQTTMLLETVLCIHMFSETDASALLKEVWKKINRPVSSREDAEKRRQKFLLTAAVQFTPEQIAGQKARIEKTDICLGGIGQMRAEEWNIYSQMEMFRCGYTLFKPLRGKTDLGTAAVLMDEKNPKTVNRLLAGVKNFEELPVQALSCALIHGAVFPLPDRPLNIEEMDVFAARLAQNKDALYKITENAVSTDFSANWQTLLWTRGLVLAAVHICDWTDEVQGLSLAKAFADVERAFLTAYYTPEALQELSVLPAMHRFGWRCAQAFDALESGDAASYARFLREGLTACEGMKKMVEFLLDHTPALQEPKPSSELLHLAEQVRMILSAYPPDDPAVAALKASAAYQKVACLIEKPEMAGGLVQ